MAKVVVGMTTSLDGFINDRNGSVARLCPDLAAPRKTEMLQEAIANTGAVVMGRRAYEMANGDFTGYEFQVPIFVITHQPPKAAAKATTRGCRSNSWATSAARSRKRRRRRAQRKSRWSEGRASPSNASAPDWWTSWRSASSLSSSETAFGFSRTWGRRALELETIKVVKSPDRTDIRYRVVR